MSVGAPETEKPVERQPIDYPALLKQAEDDLKKNAKALFDASVELNLAEREATEQSNANQANLKVAKLALGRLDDRQKELVEAEYAEMRRESLAEVQRLQERFDLDRLSLSRKISELASKVEEVKEARQFIMADISVFKRIVGRATAKTQGS